ncbi:unnamed protein product, partial [Protopolystoma xenopodis]
MAIMRLVFESIPPPLSHHKTATKAIPLCRRYQTSATIRADACDNRLTFIASIAFVLKTGPRSGGTTKSHSPLLTRKKIIVYSLRRNWLLLWMSVGGLAAN